MRGISFTPAPWSVRCSVRQHETTRGILTITAKKEAGDMLDIKLIFAWQDGDHRLHRWWRDAVEDLARKTEALIGAMQFHEQMHPGAIQFHEKMHHRAFAMLVRNMWERFSMHPDLS